MDQMVYRQLLISSSSLAGTDANGVVDLSSKLDDEISILRWKVIHEYHQLTQTILIHQYL